MLRCLSAVFVLRRFRGDVSLIYITLQSCLIACHRIAVTTTTGAFQVEDVAGIKLELAGGGCQLFVWRAGLYDELAGAARLAALGSGRRVFIPVVASDDRTVLEYFVFPPEGDTAPVFTGTTGVSDNVEFDNPAWIFTFDNLYRRDMQV